MGILILNASFEPKYAVRTGISKGLNKGHKINMLPRKKKEHIKSKKKDLITSVITETVGYQPYERKLLEMCKDNSSQKKAYKFAKKRLGSHKRALKKREIMTKIAQKK